MTAKYKKQFKLLCKEFEDIFSKDSTDFCKTPLITMDIDTGDSQPVCQKPYNLPLKQREWVQKELETLEKVGVIVRSISPWASPIVVVPKKPEPGEPPRSDHLPLKRFLQKNTLNSKVNNWSVEISPCRIQFEYIKGIKNTLADTMSRLIQIDTEAKLQPEQEGYEFGYHAFEDMEPI